MPVTEPITDTARAFVLAAAFWLVGTIIFLVAAYKVYQPKPAIQPPPRPPVVPDGCYCECCVN